MYKKIAVVFLSLIIALNISHIYGKTAILVGDLNDNGMIDAFDMVSMYKYLLNIEKEGIAFESIDLHPDNIIDILDFIKLKKLLAGKNRNVYGNYQNNGVSWIILNDVNGQAIVFTLGYRVITSCHVTTNETAERTVYEVTAFCCADKNPNPEVAYPDLTIGNTTINNKSLTMNSSDNVSVSKNWIWDFKTSYPNSMSAPQNSKFNSLINCMHKDAIVALNVIENGFEF